MKRLVLTILLSSLTLAATAAPTVHADAVNAAGKQPIAGKPGSAALLRAQILLDRVHFSSGEIDGAMGSNLRQALAGFQRLRGLAGEGQLDAATWQALNTDGADVLVPYIITDADASGPFRPIPTAMADKSRLPALGYTSPIEALGEKFHINPALLIRLNPGKDLTKAGVELLVPNVLDTEPLPKAGKIEVDRSASTLTLYDTAGVVVAQFPASTGSSHDPLPVGTWKVQSILRNPVFHYNPKLFWDAKPGDKKARIPAGPNNPVGVAWLDLSKDHYGIHGTPLPATIGKTQSHGCIRLTNWDVAALADSVDKGTEVVLQE